MSLASAEFPKPISRLKPSEMFDFALDKILHSRIEIEDPVEVKLIEPEQGSSIYGAEICIYDQSIVLMSPACDEEEVTQDVSTGASPLPLVLKEIRKLQKKKSNQIFMVPLAECQSQWVSLFKRQHWVTLIIQENDCYFYDPYSKTYLGINIYSLESLKAFLNQENILLLEENICYLDWQNDNDNCGRYCASIFERAAQSLLSKQEQSLANVKKILVATESKPELNALIEESQTFITDRRISSCVSIRKARAQGIIETRLYRRDLIDSLPKSTEQISNIALMEAEKNNFFEKGEGGLKQFISDVLRIDQFYIKNKKLVDMFGALEPDFVSLAKVLDCSTVEAQNIIVAHSQGPFAFIPMVLGHGLKELSPSIVLKQPDHKEKLRIDLIKNGEQFYLFCQYVQFPIVNLKTAKLIGYIDDVVVASYRLKQKNGAWGWELSYVETQNNDLMRIFMGQLLPERHINGNYTNRKNRERISNSLLSSVELNSNYFVNETLPESDQIINIKNNHTNDYELDAEESYCEHNQSILFAVPEQKQEMTDDGQLNLKESQCESNELIYSAQPEQNEVVTHIAEDFVIDEQKSPEISFINRSFSQANKVGEGINPHDINLQTNPTTKGRWWKYAAAAAFVILEIATVFLGITELLGAGLLSLGISNFVSISLIVAGGVGLLSNGLFIRNSSHRDNNIALPNSMISMNQPVVLPLSLSLSPAQFTEVKDIKNHKVAPSSNTRRTARITPLNYGGSSNTSFFSNKPSNKETDNLDHKFLRSKL